ncbi:hypothetical protein NKG05_16780 [Oerskovia sp. M15]
MPTASRAAQRCTTRSRRRRTASGPGANAFPTDLQEPGVYGYNMASAVALLDVVGLQGYRPLVADGAALTSASTDLQAEPGELAVAFALFPELPEGLTTVDVRIGRDVVAGFPWVRAR